MDFQAIPKDILSLIPKYDGEENQLNLFLSKCDYVINGSTITGNHAQNLYLFHAISSRLTGRAATLLSDHPNICSYIALKEILTQHFGDPRSEECIAIELETTKIKHSETYKEFCHRIQNIRSSLFAKVNRLTDEGVKAAKMIVYNNTALNVFLYNLPEDMIRIVRLKGCVSLENALSIVTEEVNFKFQYESKNRLLKQTPHLQNIPKVQPLPQGFKPPFNAPPNSNFRFGIPQNNSFGTPQNQGFRPTYGAQPTRFTPPTHGFRFGAPANAMHAPQRNFGQAMPPRAPFQHGNFRFGVPHQQNHRFGIPNQFNAGNQFRFGIPHQQPRAPQLQDSDVTMRTAPIRQNMLTNEMFYEEPSYYQEYAAENNYDGHADYNENSIENYVENPENTYEENYTETSTTHENFPETASMNTAR